MPDVILPFPQEGRSDKETIQNVIDTVIRLRKELEFLLNNLDSQNVLEAATVKADWIYAGNIKASQIDVTEAKIQSAQIEELTVGTNVGLGTAQDETGVTTIVGGLITTDYISALGLEVGKEIVMGDNATISWSKVTGAPSIPVLPSYIQSTYIDSANVISPNITGGTITGGEIKSNSTINITTSAYIGENLYLQSTGNSTIVMSGVASIGFRSSDDSLRLSAVNTVAVEGWEFRTWVAEAGTALDMKNYNISNVGNMYTASDVDSAISAAISAHVTAMH